MATVTVTSTKSIRFPKLNWGISAGEERELPEDKAAQERILAEPEISKVKSSSARASGTGKEVISET